VGLVETGTAFRVRCRDVDRPQVIDNESSSSISVLKWA
jgi:hypothetical protein